MGGQATQAAPVQKCLAGVPGSGVFRWLVVYLMHAVGKQPFMINRGQMDDE